MRLFSAAENLSKEFGTVRNRSVSCGPEEIHVPRVHPILGPAALALWLTAMAAGAPLRAQEIEGVDIEPHSGTYLVLKDANVRARPETRSKKIGRFDAGDKVEATGRVKGPWLAVMTNDKTLGFVYGPILMPIIKQAGIDPVYFGVLFIVNNSIGLITPPVGVVLNVVAGVARIPMADLIRAVWPFMWAEIVVLFLMVIFPSLVTVPARWFGG